MTANSSIRKDIAPIIAALIIVNIMFWMDEGYYDFRWMKGAGNWFFFLLYTAAVIAGELFVKDVFFSRIKERYQTPLTILTGIPLGIILAISAIISMGLVIRLIS